MAKFDRMLVIYDLIVRGRHASPDGLAQRFEVSKRSIYKDVEDLRNYLGLQIDFDKARDSYVCEKPTQPLPPFELTSGELFSLMFADDLLHQYAGTSLHVVFSDALEKVKERLPEKVKVNTSELTAAMHFRNASGAVNVPRKMFLELAKAADEQHLVEIHYRPGKNGQLEARQVEPYQLVHNASTGVWYLLARCLMRNRALRLFALHRIEHYKVSRTPFERINPDEVDAMLESSFVLASGDPITRCSIRFDATAARYIRGREWHASRTIDEHPDGSCTLSFTTTNLDATKRWVMYYGKSAEVLAPESLRTLVAGEFRGAADRYESPAVAAAVAAQRSKAPGEIKLRHTA